MDATARPTPLLDQLETGPWPSFVREMKRSAEAGSASARDLLGLLERTYEDKIGHWRHGGIVGVFGYGSGVIGRHCDLPGEFPHVAHFHTLRVNQPAGWFYTAELLRRLCDIWDEHGSGVTNFHGSTGDILLLGAASESLEPVFKELTHAGFDLGGSGSALRTPTCCCGMARCEWALYDTMALTHDLTIERQDELHRPAFPHKFKIKCAGCPNDCVGSVARADLAIVGTWKDDIQVDAAEIERYAQGNEVDIQQDVVDRCPRACLAYDGGTLSVDDASCVRCMHCINVMHRALSPGRARGATVLVGAKPPVVGGERLASVLVPFLEVEPPFEEVKELLEAIWELWAEHGQRRERVGEFVERIGLGRFLEELGLDPCPELVVHPRTNPYVFFAAGEDEEDL